MPTPKTKSRSKPAKKPSKPKTPVKTDKAKKPAAKSREVPRLDVSAFPPESLLVMEKRICLACVLDIFTRHLGLTARAAYLEVKKYTPSLADLSASSASRPWFADESDQKVCPYCGSPSKWHTALTVYRIESGKATDALRRELIKSLPQANNQFVILEEKATQQDAFFEWLEKISGGLDLDDPVWLRDVSLHYLSRREPKTDWQAEAGAIHDIRRSRRLESGWEIDNGRLFLAPFLFDELLLVQYLISRSHRAGGLTLEGRYTLPELFARLRGSGYLRAAGIPGQNPSDALEQLVTYLGGGEGGLKFYHVLDRRDFLEKVKSLHLLRPPKPKAPLQS
jgi:hypothetical protein